MSLSDLKTMKSERGFTIVELLIVIVIIGILAAIVIVAYTGITQRANANAAKANGQSVQKVAEAYAADTGNGAYPANAAALNAWTTGIAKVPNGVTVVATPLNATSHSDGKTILYVAEGTTGSCVGYWDASAGAIAWFYTGTANAGVNGATPSCT